MTDLIFRTVLLGETNSKLPEYSLEAQELEEKDKIFMFVGTGANYSHAGFEMRWSRHMTKYIIEYYITSSLFVFVSWVKIILCIFIVQSVHIYN